MGKALREDLTGCYESMQSTDSEVSAEQWPQPASEIEVIKQSQASSDGAGDEHRPESSLPDRSEDRRSTEIQGLKSVFKSRYR